MSVFNPPATMAVFKRQFASFLGNPLGYIFIFAFVVLAGVFLFWPDAFFERNICDFAGLAMAMPVLLVILVPALGMNTWAGEREHGTEELLLTMPVSIFDAIMGKFLAIVAFFTVALVFNLCHVAFLAFLGDPDWGLLFGNMLGWWFTGLAFAALALAASTMVSSAAIAWVLGLLFCAGFGAISFFIMRWTADFDRGVLNLGGIIWALCVAGIGLAVAMLRLEARRWNLATGGRTTLDLIHLALAVLVAVNLSRISYRYSFDVDVTAEGLTSLSPVSAEILKKLDNKAALDLFLSKDMPKELLTKRQEIMDKVNAIRRLAGDKVEIRIREPEDALAPEAVKAVEQYGLRTRQVRDDTAAGRSTREIFMGAVISCGKRSLTIDYFDPGLSVEYELIRAIRTVSKQATAKKPVLGILRTGVEINGGFDMNTMGSKPKWEMIQEWEKQYEIREVGADSSISDEISVLVAICPSSLKPGEAKHLHDYIWAGRPCLMMVDPMPIFDPSFSPNQPRPPANRNPFMNQGQPPPEPKEDIKPLIAALGVDFDIDAVAWADSNKGHMFQNLPPHIIWSTTKAKCIDPANELTKDMQAVLALFPGAIFKDPKGQTAVEGLVKLPAMNRWGYDTASKFIQPNFFGQPQFRPVQFPTPSGRADDPYLAVRISGKMPHAYGSEDAKKDDDKKDAADKKDEKKDDKPKGPNKGQLSDKPINVILIADADLMHDQFYAFYRNEGGRFGEDELKTLTSLNNIQFMANVVDALSGDKEYLGLRNRRPLYRTLTEMDNRLADTEKIKSDARNSARIAAEAERAKAQAKFDADLKKIQDMKDIDELERRNLEEQTRIQAQRVLESEKRKVDEDETRAIRKAESKQRQEVQNLRTTIKALSVGIPALVLLLLVVFVFSMRLVRERMDIPAARRRA